MLLVFEEQTDSFNGYVSIKTDITILPSIYIIGMTYIYQSYIYIYICIHLYTLQFEIKIFLSFHYNYHLINNYLNYSSNLLSYSLS